MINFWELLTLGVVGEFRRAIRKQCSRSMTTKAAVCSLLCINNRICGVYTLILLHDSLACVAGTYWLYHQKSQWPLQPCMTCTFAWMNCSWTVISKILGTSSPFTYFSSGAISADSFLFSLFRLFLSFIFLFFFLVRQWFLLGVHPLIFYLTDCRRFHFHSLCRTKYQYSVCVEVYPIKTYFNSFILYLRAKSVVTKTFFF